MIYVRVRCFVSIAVLLVPFLMLSSRKLQAPHFCPPTSIVHPILPIIVNKMDVVPFCSHPSISPIYLDSSMLFGDPFQWYLYHPSSRGSQSLIQHLWEVL